MGMGSMKTNTSSVTFCDVLVQVMVISVNPRTIADGAKRTNSRSIHCPRNRPKVVSAADTGMHWKTKMSRLIMNEPKLSPKPTPIQSRKTRLGESLK
jgi:hypothetical protein